jgi:hypothetical protein
MSPAQKITPPSGRPPARKGAYERWLGIPYVPVGDTDRDVPYPAIGDTSPCPSASAFCDTPTGTGCADMGWFVA